MRANGGYLARRVLAALAILVATGCTVPGGSADPTTSPGSPAASPSVDLVAALRRPWAQPKLPEGKPCPVTTDVSTPDPDLAPLVGLGPARPILDEGASLTYVTHDQGAGWVDHTWGGAKVLWAVDPAQTGPVLVRGRQLDGPGKLAFEDPAIPELVLHADSPQGLGDGWHDNPSYTRLRAPGCYAYQIDTADSTWTVVFTARGPKV